MRVLVFFDLPTETAAQRRNYVTFRKFLLCTGFIMLQESVYTKIAPNTSVAQGIQDSVRRNKPEEGNVQMLTITEKQFQKMELLTGTHQTEVIDDDRRLVII